MTFPWLVLLRAPHRRFGLGQYRFTDTIRGFLHSASLESQAWLESSGGVSLVWRSRSRLGGGPEKALKIALSLKPPQNASRAPSKAPWKPKNRCTARCRHATAGLSVASA